MSIINDALKKTQQSRKQVKEKRVTAIKPKAETEIAAQRVKVTEQKTKQPNPTKAQFSFLWKMGGFLTISAMLMILITQQGKLLGLSHRLTTNPIVESQQGKLQVNFEGSFVSDNKKIALINKQPMQVGDLLNGMPITQIEQDRITVHSPDGMLELKAGATYLL